jgi:hypothetical protein
MSSVNIAEPPIMLSVKGKKPKINLPPKQEFETNIPRPTNEVERTIREDSKEAVRKEFENQLDGITLRLNKIELDKIKVEQSNIELTTNYNLLRKNILRILQAIAFDLGHVTFILNNISKETQDFDSIDNKETMFKKMDLVDDNFKDRFYCDFISKLRNGVDACHKSMQNVAHLLDEGVHQCKD